MTQNNEEFPQGSPDDAEGDQGTGADVTGKIGKFVAGVTAQFEPVNPGEEEDGLPAEFLQKRREAKKKRLIKFSVIGGVALVAVIVVLVVVLTQGSSSASQQSGTSTYTEQVTKGNLDLTVDGSGTLSAKSTSSVSAEVSGTVKKIYVSEGDSVEKGDTLFTISSDDVADEVTSAANSLSSAKETYEEALQAYEDAKDSSSSSTTTAGASSTNSTTSAKQAVTQAKSSYQSALQSYENALQDEAKLTVTADQAGTITAINISVGDTVGSGSSSGSSAGTTSSSSSSSAAMTISDDSKMTVTTQVSEYDIGEIKIGQKAKVTVTALDKTLSAKVTQIASTASSSSSSSSSGSSTTYYDVTLTIPHPTSKMVEDMNVTTEIAYASYENALLVPTGAITTSGDTSTVTVQSGDSTKTVTVTVLGGDDDTTAIESSDIAEGDTVVVTYQITSTSSSSSSSSSSSQGGMGAMMGATTGGSSGGGSMGGFSGGSAPTMGK